MHKLPWYRRTCSLSFPRKAERKHNLHSPLRFKHHPQFHGRREELEEPTVHEIYWTRLGYKQAHLKEASQDLWSINQTWSNQNLINESMPLYFPFIRHSTLCTLTQDPGYIFVFCTQLILKHIANTHHWINKVSVLIRHRLTQRMEDGRCSINNLDFYWFIWPHFNLCLKRLFTWVLQA